MIDTLKKKKNSIINAVIVFTFLIVYCAVAGLSFLIPVLIISYGFHLYLFKRADARRFLQLGLLLALMAATAHAMTMYSRFTPYYIPVASIAMLTMLLFKDLQLSFSMSFMAAATITLMIGHSVDYLLTIFVGSLAGAYAVQDARTRGRLLAAGCIVGLAQAFAFFLAHPAWTKELWIDALRPLFINGVLSAMIVLATLKVFESLFEELTNFSLLELSDSINQPLLKRLAFEAPGTYHHSLVLSNLAGSAADAIGANALLTRVGAYYHDVGKLVKPEYFTENQSVACGNKHDELEPSMSRLVILNHVKEGVELAQKYKISPRIIDFIQQHHGTSIIYYFYQKALEETADAGEVQEENYRYPGPKPQTREVALVMLADSVEGATRALDEHTPTKISDVVRKVVNNKFIDGQLEECNLTLREIDQICDAFTRTLSAMYHVRVKYPDPQKKTNGNNG